MTVSIAPADVGFRFNRALASTVRRRQLGSTAVGLALALAALAPTAAHATSECGAATLNGTVTCSNPNYPSGISYSGLNGLTVNIAPGTTVGRPGFANPLDLEGTGAITLNALGVSSASTGGGGSTFSFSGPNYRVGQAYGVLGYSQSGPLSLSIGQSSTLAAGSVGIGGYSNTGSVAVQTNKVTLTGANSVGINVEGASASVTSGQIDATLRGIVAFGDAGGVTVSSSTINIVNNGPNAGLGIQAYALSGTGDISVTSGSITATGSSPALGITTQSGSANGKLTIVSGSIDVHGLGDYGIAAFGPAAVDITSTGAIKTNGDVRFVNDPKVGGGTQVDPRYSAGIWVIDPTNSVSIKNQGSISTVGAAAHGIVVEAGTQITSQPDVSSTANTKPINIVSNRIQTNGQGADGILIQADLSPVSVTSGTVIVSGLNSNAIDITAADALITLTSTDAETTDGKGINVQNNTGGVTVNSGTVVGREALVATGPGAISITSGVARGTDVAVAGLGGSVTISSQDASSTGSGVAVAGLALGDVSITSGVATTSGPLTIKNGVQTVAYGVLGVSQNGAVSITDTTVTTSGIFAPGIYAQAHNGLATVNSGSVTTSGAGSRGIFVQANSAIVNSTSVTTTGAVDTNFGGGATPSNSPVQTDNFGAGQVAADGIFVNVGSGGATVKSGTVNTVSGTGITVLGGAGALNVTSGSISSTSAWGITTAATTGAIGVKSTAIAAGGVGIFANTQGAVSINSGSIASGDLGIYAVGGGVSIGSTTMTAVKQGIHATAGTGGVTITSGALTVDNGGAGPLDGYYADGINATASGGLINIAATTTATNGANATGIYASNSAGGVTINSGTIKATGSGDSGIVAYAQGGDINITSTSLNASGTFGIYANDTAGAITIKGGSIQGAFGIVASTAGAISVASTSITSSSEAINLTSDNSISITSGTAVGRGDNYPVIWATNTGLKGGGNTIVAGDTSGFGVNSAAIVSSNLGKGLNTISVSGKISSQQSYGILTDGNTNITVQARASVTGAVGVASVIDASAVGANGRTTLTNFGSITSTNGAAVQLAGGALDLENRGVINGAVTIGSSGASGTIDNFGTINGAVTVSANGQPAVDNFGTINGLVTVSGPGVDYFVNRGVLNGSLLIGGGGGGANVALTSNSTVTGKLQYVGAKFGGQIQLSGGGTIAGTQFSGFDSVFKNDDGRWTITGAQASQNAGWYVTSGVVSVADIAALGPGYLVLSGTGELEVTANTSGALPVFLGQGINVPDFGAGINVAAGATYTMSGAFTGAAGIPLYVNGGGGTGELIFGRDNRATFASDIYVFRGGIYAAVTGAFGTGKIHIYDPDIGLANGVNISNDIDLQATLNINQDAGAGVISGTISESVAGVGVTTTGPGTVGLSGVNTYTGATTIGSGGLALIGAGSIATSSSVVDNGVLDISLANSGAAIQSLSGAGQVLLGTQTLTLTHAADTFSGTISGSGGLTVAGGSETLTGVNTYSGPTTIANGALVLNGSLPNSVVSIGPLGSLQGTGTVSKIATSAGSAIAPGGASFGVLALGGNLNIAPGSFYQVNADATGRSDLIAAGGSASIGGSSVQVIAAPGVYARNTAYRILTATGGVNGTFTGAVSNLAFLTPTLVYASNEVDLILSNNSIPFQSVAITANQTATASALYASNPNSTLFNAVIVQSDVGARQSFDALSGEIYATAPAILLDGSHYVRDAILDRLRQSSSGDGAGASAPQAIAGSGPLNLTAWGQLLSADIKGSFQQSGNDAGSRTSAGGAVLGVDGEFRGWRVGAAVAQMQTHIALAARSSHEQVTSSHLALYAGGPVIGAVSARVGVDYAWNGIEAGRSVVFPGFHDEVGGHFGARTEDAFAELGYRAAMGPLVVEPFANLTYARVETDGYSEGGGAAALNVSSATIDGLYSQLGVRISASMRLNPGAVLRPYAAFGWRHLYSDAAGSAALRFSSTNVPFTVKGAALDKETGTVEAGLALDTAVGARLTAGYVGQISDRWQDHQAKLSLVWSF